MADLASFLGGFTGGTIGSAVVRLNVDNAAYQKQLVTSEAQLKGFSTNAGSQLSKFGAYATAAWAAAGIAIVKFASDAVGAAVDHEAALATLRNAVGDNTAAYEEQASALQLLTGVQDEEILRADAIISRFNLTASEVQQAIPVILDFARAQGVDVTSAAQSVGKALLGNTRALKAVGINYTVTGKAGQDYAAIMELLQEKVGGASTELSEVEKRTIKLRVAFDEMKESVGGGLLAVLGPLAQELGETVTAVQQLTSTIGVSGGGGGGLMRSLLDFEINGLNLADGLDIAQESVRRFDGALGGIKTSATPAEGALEHLQTLMKDAGIAADRTRRKIELFAGKTGKDLSEWRQGIKEDFAVVGETVIGFKAKFEGTVRAFAHGLQNMKTRLKEQVRDLKEFNSLQMGENIRKFFLEQGPDAIHAFVEANKDQRNEFTDNAQSILKDQGRVNDQLDKGTGKANDLKRALGTLGGIVSKAVVEVEYVITGAIDPKKDLPGLT